MSGFPAALSHLFVGLARSHPARASTTGREPTPAPVPSPPSCTVLAIDDDPAFLNGIRLLLQVAGFDVLTANTGVKGLNMLRYTPSDVRVVLLDYSMPQLNGAETLAYLRRLYPQTKVIGVTALDVHNIPSAFHDGVDGWLPKPFTKEELVTAIHAAMATASSGLALGDAGHTTPAA
jgi:CheY-like chemotaxis protein